jgi:hypothetical protein
MKQFKVKIWVSSIPSTVSVTAANSAQALSVARKLYPTARVVGVFNT